MTIEDLEREVSRVQSELPVTEEELAELETGLEGVTPGPWKVGSWRDNVFSVVNDVWRPICRVKRNDDENSDDNPDVIDAAHIARCSPDFIRRLIATLRSKEERLKEVEKALRPYAAERLSTEPEFSDLVLRSPSEEMRRHAEAIETRDRNIMAARTALQGEGK